MTQIDPAKLAEIRSRTNLVKLIERVVPLKKKGREYLGLCPFHAEKTPSFTVVNRQGDGSFFHCFGCGSHGDCFGFLMRYHSLDFPTAVAQLAGDASIDLGKVNEAHRQRHQAAAARAVEVQERDDARKTDYARRVWKESRAANGTIVETYLRCRHADIDTIGGVLPTMRFHPKLQVTLDSGAMVHHPAMVAAVQDPDGAIGAIHRTFLADDGRSKAAIDRAKRMFGPVWGGAVRLGPAAEHMLVAEGIETSYAVLGSLLRHGWARGTFSVWAALSLGNIAGSGDEEYIGERHPVPKREDHRLPVTMPDMERPGLILPQACKRVTICADMDNADPWTGEALVLRGANRWRAEGLDVRIARPPAGMDFNDLLQRGAVAA